MRLFSVTVRTTESDTLDRISGSISKVTVTYDPPSPAGVRCAMTSSAMWPPCPSLSQTPAIRTSATKTTTAKADIPQETRQSGAVCQSPGGTTRN